MVKYNHNLIRGLEMIVIIDMHIRDERVLRYLETLPRCSRVSAIQIANEFQCHQNTAQAILKRLNSAGLIRIHSSGQRGGRIVEVTNG